MQQSELKALAEAGFVNEGDLLYDKIGNVKGLKPGAKLFEQDTFKSNIAQWAWDFHDTFMKRKGATDNSFDNLIAKMPRNMAGLIAFLVHNEARIKRDATTLDRPVGLAAETNEYLSKNPVAELDALGKSISQFSAAVMSPVVAAAGPALAKLVADIQGAASAAGKIATQHPAETAVADAAVAGWGFWKSWQLFTGFTKRLFGSGGTAGEAASGAADAGVGAASATGGGLLSAITKFLGPIGWAFAAKEALDVADPKGNLWGLTGPVDQWLAGGGQASPAPIDPFSLRSPAGAMFPVKAPRSILACLSRRAAPRSNGGRTPRRLAVAQCWRMMSA